MKKLMVIALFSSLILGFTGCEKKEDTSFKHYLNTYGNDCEVFTLSPIHFLISWEKQDKTIDVIFNNSKAIEVIEHDGKLNSVDYGDSGIQLNFTDNTDYYFDYYWIK